jgi:membrane AbrB-like protein
MIPEARGYKVALLDGFPNFILTLAAGGVFSFIFVLLKVPNALRIGGLFGAALFNVFSGAAWMPSQTKFIVQVVAGALIGCTMEKSDVKRLPKVVKPLVLTLGGFLGLNMIIGALIHAFTPLDWVTSLMCGIPGGATEMPIIAADMGADSPKVALVQLARNIMGAAFFPSMVLAYDNFRIKSEAKNPNIIARNAAPAPAVKREKSQVNSFRAMACTIAIGFAGGTIGKLTGIPAGTFLFSLISALVLKLKFDFAYISPLAKKITRFASGCYIGSLIAMSDVQGFKLLALPLVITLGGYIANSFVTGNILRRACGFTRKEAMLTTAPAGASDMALNSAEIGVENTDIIIIQVFRAIIAQAVFPQIINLLLLFLH